MTLDIHNIEIEFNRLKLQKQYTSDDLYALFIIGKISRDKTIISEVTELLQQFGTEAINQAFKTRNKLPQQDGDRNKILSSLISYAIKDAYFPVGEAYKLFDFIEIRLDDEEILKKLNKNLSVITQFNSITHIHIYEGFTNGIPAEIGEITSLTNLEIEGGYTRLPDTIGNLAGLEELEIDCEGLQEIPKSIIKLSALKELDIMVASKTEEPIKMPFNLSALKQLERLTFYKINVENLTKLQLPESLKKIGFYRLPKLRALPQSVAKLKNLERLEVYNCPLLETIPDEISELEQLTYIRLQAVPLIKQIKDTIIFAPSITSLTLDDTIEITTTQTYFKNTELSIRDTRMLSYVLTHAKYFSNLRRLSLGNFSDFDTVKVGLEHLTNLEEISASSLHNSDVLWKKLAACKHLKKLSFNYVDLEGIPNLSTLQNLKTVSIGRSNNFVLDTDHLPKDLEKLDLSFIKGIQAGENSINSASIKLEGLTLEDPKALYRKIITPYLFFYPKLEEDYTPEDLIPYLQKPEVLKTLYTSCPIGSFESIFKYCTQLERLSIDNKTEDKTELQSHPTTQLKILRLTNYKGSNLKEIVTNTPNLELLFINDYYSLDTFPEVDLPKLENLFLVSTSFEGLQNLKAAKLDRLHIFMCYEFTPEAYAAIQQFTSLKKLSFSGSDNITTIPKEITTLHLTEFLMEHDVDEFPDYIKSMTTLETLSLGANAFENLPLWIADLPNLTRLCINHCRFENPVSDYFKKLKLVELKYYTNKFSGYNMPYDNYRNLITPNYTKQVAEFSNNFNVYAKDS
ncbi:hypothetical protein MQE36_09900 [Zhouia spongiae]|uniref:Leucine-rich repeat domain-containing protein n=1 Tax=Zhouia spongiae TaxID=2202721 RepID=A0ABY3YHM5_9FLAO|nr:hypothetical protein [Zhouia spongiae]UNY97407.1 hypothetical protein MQE36_09900 [Zhouia spongiae]